MKAIISLIAGVTLSATTGAAVADTFKSNSGRTYTNAVGAKLIAGCVDAIEDHHNREARLFLNKKGVLATEDGQRVFSIQGWVWKDGDRVKAMHDCSVAADGSLLVSIGYADQNVATSDEGSEAPRG